VRPRRLITEFARHGVRVEVRGARPTLTGLFRWRVLRGAVGGRIVPSG
jgi:2-polyprenyl-6-hydroxyphenyl methylase/3-demethylubiquinone-9 3-methyltransferase